MFHKPQNRRMMKSSLLFFTWNVYWRFSLWTSWWWWRLSTVLPDQDFDRRCSCLPFIPRLWTAGYIFRSGKRVTQRPLFLPDFVWWLSLFVVPISLILGILFPAGKFHHLLSSNRIPSLESFDNVWPLFRWECIVFMMRRQTFGPYIVQISETVSSDAFCSFHWFSPTQLLRVRDATCMNDPMIQ